MQFPPFKETGCKAGPLEMNVPTGNVFFFFLHGFMGFRGPV